MAHPLVVRSAGDEPAMMLGHQAPSLASNRVVR